MTVSSPRVLFLTHHLPYPPLSGGRRRDYELLKRVGPRLTTHVCAVSKTFDEDARNAPVMREFCASVSVFPTDSEPDLYADASAFPFQVLRHRAPAATDHVAALVASGEVDVLHVEGFYLMQHVPEPCPIPVFLVEQNVEYVLWRQRTANCDEPRLRQRYLHEYLTTLESEIAAWRRATMCGAITPEDRDIMRSAVAGLDVRLVPDGADHLDPPRAPLRQKLERGLPAPLVVFAANFGYQPNVDAAVHLCRDIWPVVKAREPRASLYVVGNAPPAEVSSYAGSLDVVVTGRVPHVEPFIDAADVVVCPLRVGGGIKVKVLEALSRGKAIVSTSIGVQGFAPGIVAAVRVEDDAIRFAHAVATLLRKPRRRAALEARARRFARTLPTWEDAAAALIEAYDELAARIGPRQLQESG